MIVKASYLRFLNINWIPVYTFFHFFLGKYRSPYNLQLIDTECSQTPSSRSQHERVQERNHSERECLHRWNAKCKHVSSFQEVVEEWIWNSKKVKSETEKKIVFKISVLMMNNFSQLKFRLNAMVILEKNEANEFLNVNCNFWVLLIFNLFILMEKALKTHSECIQMAFLFLQLYFSIEIIFY